MGFDIVNGIGPFPVGRYWWRILADYARHIAPSITAACRHWYTNDGDGLTEDHARQLGAELQRSVDNCSIDDYARQLFALLCQENSVPDWVEFDDGELFDHRKRARHEQERLIVNEFIGEVQRFIEFLLACDGFEIH
jgi:hypothetical protein